MNFIKEILLVPQRMRERNEEANKTRLRLLATLKQAHNNIVVWRESMEKELMEARGK